MTKDNKYLEIFFREVKTRGYVIPPLAELKTLLVKREDPHEAPKGNGKEEDDDKYINLSAIRELIKDIKRGKIK